MFAKQSNKPTQLALAAKSAANAGLAPPLKQDTQAKEDGRQKPRYCARYSCVCTLFFLFVATQALADEHPFECIGIEPTWKLVKNKNEIELTLDSEKPSLRYGIKDVLHTTNSNVATVFRAALAAGSSSSIDESTNPIAFELLLKPNPECRLESDLNFDFESFLIFEDFMLHGCCHSERSEPNVTPAQVVVPADTNN